MLTVEIQGLKVVKRRFNQMRDRAKMPKHAMDLIGAKAWKDVLNSFTIEQDEDGRAWKPLKHERSGKRHKGGSKLLRDTGRLRSSIRWAANKTEARVFTKTKYAGYHEYGTKFIPKRSFMWIDSKLRLQFMRNLLNYIKG